MVINSVLCDNGGSCEFLFLVAFPAFENRNKISRNRKEQLTGGRFLPLRQEPGNRNSQLRRSCGHFQSIAVNSGVICFLCDIPHFWRLGIQIHQGQLFLYNLSMYQQVILSAFDGCIFCIYVAGFLDALLSTLYLLQTKSKWSIVTAAYLLLMMMMMMMMMIRIMIPCSM